MFYTYDSFMRGEILDTATAYQVISFIVYIFIATLKKATKHK